MEKVGKERKGGEGGEGEMERAGWGGAGGGELVMAPNFCVKITIFE
jgi:hypothetical protein